MDQKLRKKRYKIANKKEFSNVEKSMTKKKYPPMGCQHLYLLFLSAVLILAMLVGCGSSTADLEAVDYTPLPGDDWQISTPAEQGLDPMLVAEFYLNAAELETLYGLLVVKNGHLIAEGYFNEGTVEQKYYMASATRVIHRHWSGLPWSKVVCPARIRR